MEINYEVKKILSPEIVGLSSIEYGEQLWAVSNLTKKKIGKGCAICSSELGKKAYRPTTNKSNRMDRICIPCIEKLKGDKE
ncbi:hypothetical protein LCGC14_1747350 [marine sediment metagenome]|uniref:Uncharacterized protein n=1 Tax=marine sediment metagenome TaxID=412755 RepID=A0A0F9H4Z0_9ZZZZ